MNETLKYKFRTKNVYIKKIYVYIKDKYRNNGILKSHNKIYLSPDLNLEEKETVKKYVPPESFKYK